MSKLFDGHKRWVGSSKVLFLLWYFASPINHGLF